jgi:hypothetical protein
MARPAKLYSLADFNISDELVTRYTPLFRKGQLKYSNFINLKHAIAKQTQIHNIYRTDKLPEVKTSTVVHIAKLLYRHKTLTCEQLAKLYGCKVRHMQQTIKNLLAICADTIQFPICISFGSRLNRLTDATCTLQAHEFPY